MANNSLLITIFSLHFFTIFTTISSSSSPQSNFTLFGTSRMNRTAITLTSQLPNCSPDNPVNHPNTGRVFFKNPILFTHSNLSFFTHFTFQIIPPSSFSQCGFGEGIAFLITPEYNSLPYSVNCIGLPGKDSNSKFLAVEFDSSFDENLGDINDNHVGIDLNSINSIASVDLMANSIDLKTGKSVSCWVEYKSYEKEILVWVGLARVKPDAPVLVAPVDLAKMGFNGFFYVGFSGSNGKGSSVYMVNSWEFKTYESEPGAIEAEEIGSDNCLVCFPEATQPKPEYEKSGFRKNHHHSVTHKLGGIKLAIGLLVFNIILILGTICIILVVCMCVKKKHGPGLTRRGINRPDRSGIPKRLKLSEIRSATKGFHRNLVIGEGASATVYKAEHRKQSIAVKRFKNGSFNAQFATEYATNVGELQHKNLMKLLGWCCEKNEFILVYDYMLNGSLDKILQNQILAEKFNFSSRLNVLLGISSALVYLHEERDQQMIHRNVKTSNVMLNYDFTPKLGNVVMDLNMSRDITVPARVMGYLAPEYVYSRVPTVKVDVYSFGVVVLEMASGRPAVDENGVVVSDWVWDLWEEKRLVSVADRNLVGKFDRSEMERVLKCGLVCVHPNYEMRPVMKEVVKMLKGEIVVVLPEVKPTVMIQSVTETSSEVAAVSGGVSGGDDGLTSYGTPVSHFSK